MELDSLPFSDCAEDFGASTLNLYYSSPSTHAAIAALLRTTRGRTAAGGGGGGGGLGGVRFLDLGCGDGRLVIHVAKTLGVRADGVDCCAASIQDAVDNAAREGVSHLVTFTVADFTLWDDISQDFTWVAAYLPLHVLGRLRGLVERWDGRKENWPE
ncbi:hypothetical protein BDR26DRAFT_1009299 [Obelidium mucronatum]|nr:hypothetical protein BDR26DRAFT_1009299 [Obelidium mucronatum]